MAGAVISDRIYMKVTEEQQMDISRELKYTLHHFGAGRRKPTVIRNCKSVGTGIVSIPSGRLDLIPEGLELKDKRCKELANFPEFKFKLRESQQEIHDQVDSSCIINAAPSWGKTFAGIAIATKLGYKTLVVVHTVALRNQWVQEVEKTLGITPGIIGSGKWETDQDIVIANIQTLGKNAHKVSNLFGTLVIDEAHHTPASTFTKVVNTSKATYKIGLSGTLERKDGMHVVLKDYFSKKLFRPKRENMMVPNIHRLSVGIPFNDNNAIPWAHRVSELLSTPNFRWLVIEAAAMMVEAGHKVLVVADRVEFLEHCGEILGDNSVVITGSVPQEERLGLMARIDQDVDIIFGTSSIFSEGISLNSLSCLILTTPINNESLLKQLIGRIVRVKEGKPTPEVLDFLLQGNTAKRQATGRLGLYIKEGYKLNNLAPLNL